MARITYTWPSQGDKNWATPMNLGLNQLLALLNTHDDILAFANGYVDGGNSTSSDAPTLDGGGAGTTYVPVTPTNVLTTESGSTLTTESGSDLNY